MFFVFKQKTEYEMRISDWSSDVCSSYLGAHAGFLDEVEALRVELATGDDYHPGAAVASAHAALRKVIPFLDRDRALDGEVAAAVRLVADGSLLAAARSRSEEHTSELQSLMSISYAVFCLKKKTQPN